MRAILIHWAITVWWQHTLLIPALRSRGRQISMSFEASLVYRVNSSTARATQRNPVFKNQEKKKRFALEMLMSHEVLSFKASGHLDLNGNVPFNETYLHFHILLTWFLIEYLVVFVPFCFVLFCFVFKKGYFSVQHWLSWNSLCRPR